MTDRLTPTDMRQQADALLAKQRAQRRRKMSDDKTKAGSPDAGFG